MESGVAQTNDSDVKSFQIHQIYQMARKESIMKIHNTGHKRGTQTEVVIYFFPLATPAIPSIFIIYKQK